MRPASLTLAALTTGLLIAWVDSRPRWDDTAVSAAALLVASAVFGALRPARAWRWALLVGVWIPLIGIGQHRNYGSLLALAFALHRSLRGRLHLESKEEMGEPLILLIFGIYAIVTAKFQIVKRYGLKGIGARIAGGVSVAFALGFFSVFASPIQALGRALRLGDIATVLLGGCLQLVALAVTLVVLVRVCGNGYAEE